MIELLILPTLIVWSLLGYVLITYADEWLERSLAVAQEVFGSIHRLSDCVWLGFVRVATYPFSSDSLKRSGGYAELCNRYRATLPEFTNETKCVLRREGHWMTCMEKTRHVWGEDLIGERPPAYLAKRYDMSMSEAQRRVVAPKTQAQRMNRL